MLKSSKILQKEKEFLKLNEEIDSRTKDLLTEVDHIKEIQSEEEKYISNWEKPESINSETLKVDEEEDKENSIQISNNSIIQDNDITDQFSQISIETPEKNNEKSSRDFGIPVEKKSFKKNPRLVRTAKTVSLIGTQDQDLTLSLGLSRHKSELALKLGNEIIPETLKEVGQDGITRFLTAKVKLLSEQLEVMQKDEKKNLEKIKELQTQKQKFTEEKDKLLHQINTGKSLLVKQEQQFKNVTNQLQHARTENNHLKKELESLKKEMRETNKNNNSTEIKLNRALEEIERLKVTMQQMKLEDKEIKETYRKKNDELTAEVKRLDRQKTELLNGFKKQMMVIDNLKQQKELVEAHKILKSAEEDFVNFLDSNPLDFEKVYSKSKKC